MLLATIAALGVLATPTLEAKLTWHEFGPGDKVAAALPQLLTGMIPEPKETRDDHSPRVIDLSTLGPAPVPDGYAPPDGVYRPRLFAMYGRSNRQLVGAVAASRADGPEDRLWIDWNFDMRFDPTEMAELSSTNSLAGGANESTFTYRELPVGDAGPIHVKTLVVGGSGVVFLPTGYMEGSVKAGGRTTRVGVADLDFDGVFGDSVHAGIPDYLTLGTPVGGLRVAPAFALVQLGDGRFWEPRISPDGGKIVFVRDEVPLGSLEFAGGAVRSIEVSTPRRPVVANVVGGKLALPAGDYTFETAAFTVRSGSGEPWTYTITGHWGPKIRIAAGSHARLAVGALPKVELKETESEGVLSFGVSVNDRCGAEVMGLADSHGKRPDPPKLILTNPAGQVAATLNFAYG